MATPSPRLPSWEEDYIRRRTRREEISGGSVMTTSRARLSPSLSLSLSFFLIAILLSFCAAQAPAKFRCSGREKCQALAAFVPLADTTYEAIKSLFQVGSIYDLYGANGLNESTPTSAKVPANAAVRVPFPCSCANGTGVSSRKPLYTAKTGDSLKKIAGETFGGLVTDLQIAAANAIVNASSIINPGKQLVIPLPCSCDYWDSSPAVHLAHVVREEMNLAEISRKYSVLLDSLLSFNNINDSKSLVPAQILDVPLYACSSSYIRFGSPDIQLLVPNGSYALTAHNCIKCSCRSPWGELACRLSPDSVNRTRPGCSWETCPADRPFKVLSNFGTYYATSCTGQQCFYAGYDDYLIWTTKTTLRYSRCDDRSGSKSARGLLRGWILLMLLPLLAF